jgi:hypothetical protein
VRCQFFGSFALCAELVALVLWAGKERCPWSRAMRTTCGSLGNESASSWKVRPRHQCGSATDGVCIAHAHTSNLDENVHLCYPVQVFLFQIG